MKYRAGDHLLFDRQLPAADRREGRARRRRSRDAEHGPARRGTQDHQPHESHHPRPSRRLSRGHGPAHEGRARTRHHVVEDAAHGFGASYKGRMLGASATSAVSVCTKSRTSRRWAKAHRGDQHAHTARISPRRASSASTSRTRSRFGCTTSWRWKARAATSSPAIIPARRSSRRAAGTDEAHETGDRGAAQSGRISQTRA